MKQLLLTSTIIALSALPLSAQEVVKSDKISSIVKNIGESLNAGQGEEAVKSEVSALAVEAANAGLDQVEDKVLSASNFTHFELSVGTDIMGLDDNKSDTKTEAMTVYRLNETRNWFIFNQTSVVNFDNRTTINTGFGARHINDAETVITGYNVFYDHELQSKHERVGAGLELLSSIFEFRANAYQAVSKTLTYNGIQETALDGYDAKLTANLPYFYSSNLYGKLSNWKDTANYEIEHFEAGINAEIIPNLTLRVATQHKKGSGNTEAVASLNYSVPLGGASQTAKVIQDGEWSTKFEPIREKLYRPVQRENRIITKAISLGVTVSGY
ncbi:inverse autotransporter beta domain-containing protein [Amylibacter sp.]|nr:inverse autotransporter beta domain-containing protein [Amylibacter sp.]MDB4130167.1 inverse autotransporter beta domain-containing protein [Amylibacter sp.]